MIPHHHLGMVLVDEATVHADDVRLRRLVFEMSGYHHSETGLLEDWADGVGIEPAATFPGDLPRTEVGQLADLRGVEHDTWWLYLMIRHHRGALTIADAQIAEGTVEKVREMAVSVRMVQAAEVEQMETLLDSLCSSRSSPSSPLAGCR